jgi:hypothetical protein
MAVRGRQLTASWLRGVLTRGLHGVTMGYLHAGQRKVSISRKMG